MLSGQQGPAYFLVPVLGDVVMEDRELRRAMARASLRESWGHAKATGSDKMNDEEIEQEIKRRSHFALAGRLSGTSNERHEAKDLNGRNFGRKPKSSRS